MTSNISFRDVEKLSAYLDGQLSQKDQARLESRLALDPDLRAILDDLRATRSLLRKLPQRRAPRNFTLTPKMVGKKPPMPAAYPFFRFATAMATLLLLFISATNLLAPNLATQPLAYGIGGYGGGGESEALEAAPAPSELPAMEESSEPEMFMQDPTETAPELGDNARIEPTPEAPQSKLGAQEVPADQAPVPEAPEPPFGPGWQITLAIVAIVSGLIALLLRYLSIRKWRAKTK